VELCAALSNISMCGREKLSLRLIQFKSLKSTQTLILSSFLGTTTMLDTHRGYLTASRKSVFHCFSISAFTKTSTWILLNFCFTGLHPSTSGTLSTRHVLTGPGKNIYIISELCNQLFSFFRGDQSMYLQLSLEFFIAHIYGFKLLSSGFPSLFMLLIFVNPLTLFSYHSSSSTTNMYSLKSGHSFSV